MSHAIVNKSAATKITDIAALEAAVKELGLLFEKCTPGKGHYRTWKDTHGGKWVGDWPLPEGVSAEAMGDNADYVIKVPPGKQKNSDCYELGIVRSEEDQCWYPAHDFWGGGNGLEEHIGKTVIGKDKKVVKSHSILMDYYQAARVAMHYRAQGKTVHLQKQPDKLVLRIQ